MDSKVLFHDPEDLDDFELGQMRSKLRFQSMCPWACAAFMGLTSAIVDSQVLRRAPRRLNIGAFSLAGLALGAGFSDNVDNNMWWRKIDPEIVNAYDQRHIRRNLNYAGLGSNWVSYNDSKSAMHNKPY